MKSVRDDDRVVQRRREAADVLFGEKLHQHDFVAKVAARAAELLGRGESRHPASPASRHIARSTTPSLSPPGDPVLGRVLIQKLCERPLENDDLLVFHEFGALDIQDGH